MKVGCIDIDLNMMLTLTGLVVSIVGAFYRQDPGKRRMRRIRRLEKRAYRYYCKKTGARLTKRERCSAAELYEAFQLHSAQEIERYLLCRGKPESYVKHLVHSCIAEEEISEEHRSGRCHWGSGLFWLLPRKRIPCII